MGGHIILVKVKEVKNKYGLMLCEKNEYFYLMICISFGKHGTFACICIGEGMKGCDL